jgi:cbb3-type cytochrome oxidase subunit 3
VSLLWGTIALLLVIVWVISVVDIVRRHLGASRTIGWILLVTVLPFIGAVVYWALRKPGQEEIERLAVLSSESHDSVSRPPFA